MKFLKIFGIITWSIFFIAMMYTITTVGFDEYGYDKYLYVDIKLDNGALFLAGLSIVMILVNIIFVKPAKKSPFKEINY
jgi:hypothetical protein